MTSILFVEREHNLRTVFAEFLRNEGYIVIEAGEMASADPACRAYGAPIDLAIIRAEAGAVRRAKQLAVKYPQLHLLLIGEPALRAGIPLPQKPKTAWLDKPFTSSALLEQVRALTRGRHASAGV